MMTLSYPSRVVMLGALWLALLVGVPVGSVSAEVTQLYYHNLTNALAACEAAAPPDKVCTPGCFFGCWSWQAHNDPNLVRYLGACGGNRYMTVPEGTTESGECVDCLEPSHCTGALGPGTNADPPVCFDTVCTEAGTCEHTFVPENGLCGEAPKPTEFSKTWSNLVGAPAKACPVVGGSLSVVQSHSVSGLPERTHCSNGCDATSTLSADVRIDANLCRTSLGVKGSVSYAETGYRCEKTNGVTCQKSCGGWACTMTENEGEVAASVSHFMGVARTVQGGFYAVNAKCGGTLALEGAFGHSAQREQRKESSTFSAGDINCIECNNCTTQESTASVSAAASLDCYFGLSFGKVSADVGCKGCASMSLSGSRGRVHTHNTAQGGGGEPCDIGECSFGRIDAKVVAVSPGITPQFGWWKPAAPLRCKMTVEACTEDNSCGTPSCADGASAEKKLSCTLSEGN